jgi:hypothetical protein
MWLMLGPDDLSLARGQRSVWRGNDVQLAGPACTISGTAALIKIWSRVCFVRGGLSLSTKIEYLKTRKAPSGQRVTYDSALGMSSPS